MNLKMLIVGGLGLLSCCSLAFATSVTTVSFYAKDQHGSIAGITDSNGNLTASSLNQYNDYGVNQSNNSNNNGQISINDDPYQYNGEYTDNESGLQPLGNGYRYYDPSLMRFISPDSYPLLNLYAYGSGNPIDNVDPTGHMSQGLSTALNLMGNTAGAIEGGIGLVAGIATADPIEIIGAVLGLVSAGSGTASVVSDVTNHQILGIKNGAIASNALAVTSDVTGGLSILSDPDGIAGLKKNIGQKMVDTTETYGTSVVTRVSNTIVKHSSTDMEDLARFTSDTKFELQNRSAIPERNNNMPVMNKAGLKNQRAFVTKPFNGISSFTKPEKAIVPYSIFSRVAEDKRDAKDAQEGHFIIQDIHAEEKSSIAQNNPSTTTGKVW